jgi:hypothetical protein
MSTLLRQYAGAVAALTLTVVVGTGPATAADIDGPDYQRPVVGECHQYGVKTTEATSDGSPAIPCTQAHSALTVAVVELPDDMSWEEEAADEDAFYEQLDTSALVACASATRKALGAGYAKIRRTAYRSSFYRPTDAQIEHGARWIRCDVNLFGGRKLQALPSGSNVKIGTISGAEQACRLWVGKTTVLTGCSSKHHYRLVKLVRIPGAKLPSQAKLMKLAGKTCEPVAGPNWWANWPAPATWADGDRILTCSRPTRR